MDATRDFHPTHDPEVDGFTYRRVTVMCRFLFWFYSREFEYFPTSSLAKCPCRKMTVSESEAWLSKMNAYNIEV